MSAGVQVAGTDGDLRCAQPMSCDTVIVPGLSVHVFDDTVGIYSNRIEASRGFAELPLADLVALIAFFARPESRGLLDPTQAL